MYSLASVLTLCVGSRKDLKTVVIEGEENGGYEQDQRIEETRFHGEGNESFIKRSGNASVLESAHGKPDANANHDRNDDIRYKAHGE
jgi:hypothetical protein